MAEAFKQHDVVQSNPDGPKMTITMMGAETPDFQNAWCVWFEGNKRMEDAFPVSELKLVPESVAGGKN